MEEPRALYFEKQVARLCGVHCVNSLLQGSYFTEVDLAQVAQELDRQEKKLMMEMGTETPDFLKFMAEDSGNVDDSGDYSIQVLQQCLEGWDLKCIPVTNPEAANALKDPLRRKEVAFICNLSNHWFTIRKCGSRWYNLNSLNDHPELLSDFYLSLYLATLVNSGWSIFVVRGLLPPVTTSTITSEGGQWVPIEQCTAKKSKTSEKAGTKKDEKGKDEQDELAKAIALSLATCAPLPPSLSPSSTPPRSSIFDQNTTSTSTSSNSFNFTSSSSGRSSDDEEDFDNDAELKAALEASELEAAIAASLMKD